MIKSTKLKPMKTSLKTLNWVTWITAGIGGLFLILGLIQTLMGLVQYSLGKSQINGARLFGDTEIINFFIASTNFFIIAMFVYLIKIQFIKE